MMFTSVIQWKKHHPTYICELHADELTFAVFKQLNALELWDSHKAVGKNKAIDKSVFWASSKLQALRYVEEPIIIMDNDFIVYKSLENFINTKPVVAHDEDGENYYLGPMDDYLKQVRHIINRPELKAINCSFLYLPDYKFTNSYAKLSLELMEEFTKLKVPNSKYLIYAEQLLLKYLLDLYNVKYDSLVDRVFNCRNDKFGKKTKGLIKYEESDLYYRHYWKEKNLIRENSKGFSYNKEVEQLEKVVKNRILIHWDKL